LLVVAAICDQPALCGQTARSFCRIRGKRHILCILLFTFSRIFYCHLV